jgi:hypothetical protein
MQVDPRGDLPFRAALFDGLIQRAEGRPATTERS